MMISADKLKPSRCIDCGTPLGKMLYGLKFDEKYHLTSPSFIRRDNHYIACACGAVYVWSFDETNQNGGVWKRRHTLPLFDDRLRIEITAAQIRRYAR